MPSSDPYYSNVQLQLSFDGSYTDASGSPLTVYAQLYAALTSKEYKYQTASLDTTWATNAGATATTGAEQAIGTQTFTIECWAKTVNSSGAVASPVFMSKWISGGYDWYFGFDTSYGLVFYANGSVFTAKTNTYAPDGSWHHYAVDRDASGTLRIYIDGVVKGTFTGFTTSITNNTGTKICIGNIAGGTQNWLGWTDSARITIGAARYGGAFTPPTSAFPVGSSDPNWSKVVLLCNFGNGLVDSSTYGKTITYQGTTVTNTSLVTLNTSYYKDGTASADFSASTSQSNVVRVSTPLAIGSQAFTLECWARSQTTWPSDSVSHALMAMWGNELDWLLSIDNHAPGFSFYQSASATYISSFVKPTDTNWHHYCAERDSSNTLRLYVDGAVVGTWTGVSFTLSHKDNLTIGNDSRWLTSTNWPGQIDMVRATIGASRYNGAFTPPASFSGTPYYYSVHHPIRRLKAKSNAVTQDNAKRRRLDVTSFALYASSVATTQFKRHVSRKLLKRRDIAVQENAKRRRLDVTSTLAYSVPLNLLSPIKTNKRHTFKKRFVGRPRNFRHLGAIFTASVSTVSGHGTHKRSIPMLLTAKQKIRRPDKRRHVSAHDGYDYVFVDVVT